MQNKNTIPFKHWSHKVGRADPVTGVVPPIYSEIVVAVDDLHQSISNLILTPLGSVPTEPEKGCDLAPYIDRHADIAIPNVTRVVWDALTMWEPRIVLQEVNLTGDVDVTADQAGEAYNDLQLGQIEDILDPVAFVSGVANVLISDGGADIESDDRFRIRIANAFERLSKGGSRQGYIENVKAVSTLISDVQVIRTQPGYIEITPLMIDGVSSDLMDAEILAYLVFNNLMPMGDYVSISKATAVTFDVVMTLKVTQGMAGAVQDQAEGIIRDRFSEWRSTLGAQVAPSALVEAVRAIAGVIGVTGPAFNFTDLPSTSFASIGLVTVNIQEVENV